MKKTVKLFAIVMALVLALMSGTAALAEESIVDIVANGRNVIAVFVPLTGEQRQYGEAISNGIKLYVEQYNEANGTNYVVEVNDDKGDSTEAANIANKIIANDKVLCAMGSYSSSCVLAAAPIFQEAGQLFLSPGASHPDVPKIGDYIYTYGINIEDEMAVTLDAIAERFDLPKFGIIYQATDHGVQTYEKTAEYYPSLGGELVAAETFIADSTTDFKSIISKVSEAGAEVVFLNTTYADGAQIIMQAEDLAVDMQWVGNSQLMQDEFLALVGDLANGLIATANMPAFMTSTLENEEAYASLGEDAVEFVNSYKEFCGANPNGFSVLGYDAASVLLFAVEKAGSTDSDALKEVMADAFLEKEGLLCGDVLEYDTETRTLQREIGVYEVIDGVFQKLS